MARNQHQLPPLPTIDWVEATNANAAAITLHVKAGRVAVRGTAGATKPAASLDGMFELDAGETILNRPLRDLFSAPGINRVWLKGMVFQSIATVDHVDA